MQRHGLHADLLILRKRGRNARPWCKLDVAAGGACRHHAETLRCQHHHVGPLFGELKLKTTIGVASLENEIGGRADLAVAKADCAWVWIGRIGTLLARYSFAGRHLAIDHFEPYVGQAFGFLPAMRHVQGRGVGIALHLL